MTPEVASCTLGGDLFTVICMDYAALRSSMYTSLLALATEDGINASGKDDVYGCIFGRDSAISILKILKTTTNPNTSEIDKKRLLDICRRSLLTLVELQGKQSILESGEEPGKFIHEYRPDNYERLLTLSAKPWYIYPDGILRNYDSLDATPLSLIALYRFWKASGDNEFLLRVLPSVEEGLNWIITYGDRDKDHLVEYELPKDRQYGGLAVQSWTDSPESVQDEKGIFPYYPIAPVEVQGYAWLALKLWADFYADSKHYAHTKRFAQKLEGQASRMKKRFNEAFLFNDGKYTFVAQALDGRKKQLQTVTGNALLLLWAAYKKDGQVESILSEEYIDDIVQRSFLEDMFDSRAGVRTMSTSSRTFDPSQNSYHNGSFWPKLNGMSHEGLRHFGFEKEAALLKEATLRPLSHFGSPVELYVPDKSNSYLLFRNEQGQESCRQQAWTAASALDLLTE